MARRALEVANDDPVVLSQSAFALGYFGEDIDAAIRLAERALTLNPSYARGWVTCGVLQVYAGNLGKGIEYTETYMRLNPRDAHIQLLNQTPVFPGDQLV